jgi:hypothetical protein
MAWILPVTAQVLQCTHEQDLTLDLRVINDQDTAQAIMIKSLTMWAILNFTSNP